MNVCLILLVIIGLCVFTYLVWIDSYYEFVFCRELKHREAMDDKRFYEKYYAKTAIPVDIPRRLRPIYGKFFNIEPAKLRPNDRPPQLVDVSTSKLIKSIEAEFGLYISDADAEKIDGSFDSIVRYLAAKKRS